jgi:kumamolisin
MIYIKHTPQKYTKIIGELNLSTSLKTIWVTNRKKNNKDTLLQVDKICKQYNLYFNKNDNYNLHINGSYAKFKDIFKITILIYQYNGTEYYAPSTNITVPPSLICILDNVFGFNSNTIVYPNFKQASYINRDYAFNPPQLAKIYKFPKTEFVDYNQTIGIIDFGNIDNNIIKNLYSYLQSICIDRKPPINLIYNDDKYTNNENLYLFTQLCIITSIALNAKINVYFAKNTEYGFYNAVNKAIIDKCNIISMSWSSDENIWLSVNANTFNNLFKYASDMSITMCSATRSLIDFPSSSPYITSCGGTFLCKKNVLCEYNESAWNNNKTSYESKIFKKPKYQNNITYNTGIMRITPDISSNANPMTGCIIYSQKQGYVIIGDTGIVPPLLSSLVAIINQNYGNNIGFLNIVLYDTTNLLYPIIKDITSGKSGNYIAINGWDPCTGLGSIIGTNMADIYYNKKPKTNFIGHNIYGYVPLTVKFNDKTIGYHNKWLWDFGNGYTSDIPNPIYIYNTVGKYTVTLTTSNINGSNKLTKKKYINVINKPLKPLANFKGFPLIGLAPLIVSFVNSSDTNICDNKSNNIYKWDFGDGIQSNDINPIHTYTFPGVYTVTLIIKNISGCSKQTIEKYITVINETPNTIECDVCNMCC